MAQTALATYYTPEGVQIEVDYVEGPVEGWVADAAKIGVSREMLDKVGLTAVMAAMTSLQETVLEAIGGAPELGAPPCRSARDEFACRREDGRLARRREKHRHQPDPHRGFSDWPPRPLVASGAVILIQTVLGGLLCFAGDIVVLVGANLPKDLLGLFVG